MTEFWFIRHGESESNAGLSSKSDHDTPLTEKGRIQSQYVSEYIKTAPDLFVISPYARAAQTAEPTISKFLETPKETWPIQEFSYLSHQLYHNTNSSQRGALSRDYFKQADPDLVLGNGGESFNQFIQRIENCLERINHSDRNLIIFFGHGWFMRATLWHLLTQRTKNDERKAFKSKIINTLPSLPFVFRLYSISEMLRAKKMFSFLLFSGSVQIPNGGILKFRNSADGNFELKDFEISHIPEDLVEITWRNR